MLQVVSLAILTKRGVKQRETHLIVFTCVIWQSDREKVHREEQKQKNKGSV